MTEEQRDRILRVIAITLLRIEFPGAPAGAAGPTTQWFKDAETVLEAIEPHLFS